MYISIKTIKGRKYAYQQQSKRVGKKVRTTSTYLGPVQASMVGGVKGLLSLRNQVGRDAAFKPIEQVFAERATRDKVAAELDAMPETIGGLSMSTQQTAQQSWEHEAGIESGAANAAPSSSGEEG